MDSQAVILVLRLLHIVNGAFWFGGVVVTGFFLLPTVLATPPIGGQFAGALVQRTRLPDVLIWAGVLTVLSGLLLYWDFYADASWSSFGPHIVYAIGAAFALVALALALGIAKPAATQLGALGRTIQAQDSPPTPEQSGERDAIMGRLAKIAATNGVLLAVAAICMAIGRYM